MAKLVWDQTGERLYETGVKKGVLYPQVAGAYPLGIAWNGLVSVTESPKGAEATAVYADNIKYLNLISSEEFGATIEAYTYPDEFAKCDGSLSLTEGVAIGQQSRNAFGLAYQTSIGNDSEGESYGYKLHIIYGAIATPSEKAYKTINESPEAITFSWALNTTPVNISGYKPTASLTIDSTKVDPDKLAALELILFGNTGVDPRLPFPDEIASIFTNAAPASLALSTSVPADSATAVVASSNIVLTFNNKIQEESILLTTATGSIVPFSKSWDSTGKIMTIDPTSNLAASTMHFIIIDGVVDIYNQTISPIVRKFTTA